MWEYTSHNFHGNLHMLANEMNFNFGPQGWELVAVNVVDPFVVVIMLRRQIAAGPFQYANPISTKA